MSLFDSYLSLLHLTVTVADCSNIIMDMGSAIQINIIYTHAMKQVVLAQKPTYVAKKRSLLLQELKRSWKSWRSIAYIMVV